MGVAGAGLATLLSRATAAAIMMFFISNKSNKIYIRKIHKIKFESNTIKTILRFGVPNGIENSMFQVGRLAVQGLISTFGTAAIAANAIAGSIIGFVQIPGGAISLSMVTVVGQCIGAGQDKWATYYVKKLLKISYLSMGALSIILFFSRSKIVSLFNLSPDAAKNAIDILAISAIFIMLFWSASFLLPSAFRAAGDNKFTMIISICSMWIFRIGFSYIVAQYFNMGLIGVWIAMFIDWIVRTIIYFSRFKSMKWIKERVT
jgi:Na+-driven multidrug efflux pump